MREEEYASSIEGFIAEYLAPEILSKQGRILIIFIWSIMIVFSAIGASHITSNFSLEFFLVDGEPVT